MCRTHICIHAVTAGICDGLLSLLQDVLDAMRGLQLMSPVQMAQPHAEQAEDLFPIPAIASTCTTGSCKQL